MIRTFRHRGLKRLYERDDPSRVGADLANRIALALADLDDASKLGDIALPGYRLHPFKGDMKGLWRSRFPATGGSRSGSRAATCTMSTWSTITSERMRTMAMKNPPHPGRSIKENCLDPLGLTVTEAAKVLGVARHTLSRVVNGHAAVSPEMAIRLEKAGWSDAEFWLRRQTSYNLAQARRSDDQIRVERYQPRPTT